jgi:hypothetical protein
MSAAGLRKICITEFVLRSGFENAAKTKLGAADGSLHQAIVKCMLLRNPEVMLKLTYSQWKNTRSVQYQVQNSGKYKKHVGGMATAATIANTLLRHRRNATGCR